MSASLLSVSLLCTSAAAHATNTSHKKHSSVAASSSKAHLKRVSATSTHGKASHAKFSTHVAMEPERATAIQSALIKNGYLTGEPTGRWDGDSIAAMQKLQSDNGWQTKVVPDSRALIKLGLGPNADAAQSIATDSPQAN